MVGARPRIPGPDDHRICDIFALLNAKSEATSTGWLLEPPLESALRRGTSNLATSAEPNCIAFIPLGARMCGRAKSFVFRFESPLACCGAKPGGPLWLHRFYPMD